MNELKFSHKFSANWFGVDQFRVLKFPIISKDEDAQEDDAREYNILMCQDPFSYCFCFVCIILNTFYLDLGIYCLL